MAYLNYNPVKKHHCDLPEITKDLLDDAKTLMDEKAELILWQCDECGKNYELHPDPYWGHDEWWIV